jgi:hypothetical protein
MEGDQFPVHASRENYSFKQNGKEIDAIYENQIVYRTSVGNHQPHRSEPQRSQSFPFTLKILQRVFLIDVMSL